MNSHWTEPQEKLGEKWEGRMDCERGGGGIFLDPRQSPIYHRHTHTHTQAHSKAQVATNANNLQVANVGGKRQQQIQQQPTSAETQKGQNKNGKAKK